MPKSSKQAAVVPGIQEVEVASEPVKKKRTMSAEALEKLKLAREKAVEARKKSGEVNRELVQIRTEIKKEKLGDRVDEVETYKKIKERVDEEIKNNEYVNINRKLEKLDDFYNKFTGYLEEKSRRQNEKKAKEIAKELPAALSQKMLEEELKRQEYLAFRKKYFGV